MYRSTAIKQPLGFNSLKLTKQKQSNHVSCFNYILLLHRAWSYYSYWLMLADDIIGWTLWGEKMVSDDE
jgi:hypothetical protein